MMTKKQSNEREQLEMLTIDQLVPENHLVREIESAIDFSFIYPLVENLYSGVGRPSIDPVVLFKMTFIQYIFGIRSMRQTIKEIETNMAYRWFLGFGFYTEVPHFSTFGKNYQRRYHDTDVFEIIFYHILKEIMGKGLLSADHVFVDSTHVKASANGCPLLSQCTESKNHQKLVQRHIWETYVEEAEHLRHTNEIKKIYAKRKETIERVFADAKEKHGMRWTTLRGLKKLSMQAMLTFASKNLKKLATWTWQVA